jgi:hypothetical protein
VLETDLGSGYNPQDTKFAVCILCLFIVMVEEMEGAESEYFNIDEGPKSPGSIHSSDSLSIHSVQPSATMASLTALQYLPVPLLVLSAEKTVLIANEAMGRLLGIDFESTAYHDFSISEVLHDKTMGDLGIDILQNGSPILVSWEVRMECMVKLLYDH